MPPGKGKLVDDIAFLSNSIFFYSSEIGIVNLSPNTESKFAGISNFDLISIVLKLL